MKALTSQGFDAPIISIIFRSKSPFAKALLLVSVKKGLFGKRFSYFKDDIEQLEIVYEQEVSDTGQRVRNAAIGVVLLGPVGLLGAAFGGGKKLIKLKICTKDKRILIVEMDQTECKKMLLDLMDLDINKVLNDQYLQQQH